MIRSTYLPAVAHGRTPPGLDYALSGAATQVGRSRAISMQQKAAGLTPDGVLSPENLTTLSAATPDHTADSEVIIAAHAHTLDLVAAMQAAMAKKLGTLDDVRQHGRVRLDRLHQVTEYAVLHAWTARTEAHAISEMAARHREAAGQRGF